MSQAAERPLGIPEAPRRGRGRQRVVAARGGRDAAPAIGDVTRQGYVVRNPKARLYGLRPKRFDGMVALEANDQHKEEIR